MQEYAKRPKDKLLRIITTTTTTTTTSTPTTTTTTNYYYYYYYYYQKHVFLIFHFCLHGVFLSNYNRREKNMDTIVSTSAVLRVVPNKINK